MQRILIVTGLLLLFATGIAYASGWDNSCIGARAAALGSAFVGLADDAVAVFYNQAGLAFIDARSEVIVGYKLYLPEFTFVDPTGHEAVSDRTASLFEGFGYYHVNDRLTVGMGIYTPYAGGGMKWEKEDIGFDLEAYLGSFAFSPAVSVRISDKIAVGGYVSVLYFISKQDVNNPLMVPNSMDAEETDVAVSYSASLFFKPNETWSFGATFRGPVDVRLEGTSVVDGAELDSETRFDLPYSISAGAALNVTPNLTIVADVDYFRWEKLQHSDKIIHYPDPVGDVTMREELGFEDSYQIEAGVEYDVSEVLSIMAGVNYDIGAVPEGSLSLTNIDVASLSLFGGLAYRRAGFTLTVSGFDALGSRQEVSTPHLGVMKYDRDSLALLVSIGRSF